MDNLKGLLVFAGLLALLWPKKSAKRVEIKPLPELDFVKLDYQKDIKLPEVIIKWRPPATANQYMPLIRKVEDDLNMPVNLVARVAYQESRFRPDVITGRVKSEAGAEGIMQIVPRWHPGVDPLNPSEAIVYGARYLNKLQAQFGSWEKALAAYNWGPGNLSKVSMLDDWKDYLPSETFNYVTEISRDVLA